MYLNLFEIDGNTTNLNCTPYVISLHDILFYCKRCVLMGIAWNFVKCDLSKKNVKYFGSHEIILIAMLPEIDRTEYYRKPVANIWIISINHVQIHRLFTIILIQIYNMILEYFYSWQGENKCILMHKKSGVIFILSWELFTFLYRSLVHITPDWQLEWFHVR